FTLVSVDIEGTATRGDEIKRFHWRLDAPTRFAACETTTTVPEGGEGRFEITIHADHLFYDSLVSSEPALRFDAFAAADADDDGLITPEELAAADIGAYDAGSEGGVDDLWAWLLAQTRTLGHVDGEAHCHASPLD